MIALSQLRSGVAVRPRRLADLDHLGVRRPLLNFVEVQKEGLGELARMMYFLGEV